MDGRATGIVLDYRGRRVRITAKGQTEIYKIEWFVVATGQLGSLKMVGLPFDRARINSISDALSCIVSEISRDECRIPFPSVFGASVLE